MRKKCLFAVLAILPLGWSVWAQSSGSDEADQPRPIELADILAWQEIRSATLSNDGKWFAYRLSPVEGDSDVVVRETKGTITYTFPGGESGGGQVSFSDDGRWLAFTVYPAREQAKKLKKAKKKLYNDITLVDLSSGEKTEFEKIKSFKFSERNPAWIALHRYADEEQGKGDDKWSGSDLIFRELATGKELNIGNVSEFRFDKFGRWLAWTIDARDQTGNGVQLRTLKDGNVFSLDSAKARYKRLTWTEEGDGLAVLKGKKDEDYEDHLYGLVGFKDLDSSPPSKVAYDPGADNTFPAGMTISPNRNPLWTEDLTGILFGIYEAKRKDEKDKSKDGERRNETASGESAKDDSDEDLPGLVIWHWQDKRLQAKQQVQEQRDKAFSYLSVFRTEEKEFLRLADEEVRRVEAAPKHRWAVGFDDREYRLFFNLDGRSYNDIYVVDLETGERRLAVAKCRWYFGPSPDGTHFLYYSEAHFFTYDMADGRSYKISEGVPTSFVDEENDVNVIDPPVRPIGWVKEGVSVLLHDNWDVWNVPVHGGEATNLTRNGKTEQIRYARRFRLDPEEKGIDLSVPVYFSAYGEWTKKAGIARLDPGEATTQVCLWDDAVYSSLLKAREAGAYLYTRATFKDYPDYYVADITLTDGTRLTEANPQQHDFLWSEGSTLVDYESEKGKNLQAALFLPASYEKGKSYPTIVYIYQRLSQALNSYSSPSANGFNKSVYTSNGYAVLMPDISYQVDDPGMSAVWCVLPALKAAIETGVVDRERVGIHGHSWGGYQTAFLITQTDAFSAAVAGAPLTNMISMYSSIYWNSGSPNQPIFESSQGRFKSGYWERIEAYTRNSPIFFAEKVSAPLIILHNDKDGAVDWNQGIEYFNTLRRLRKPVVMLQYKGENHGLRKPENRKDYTIRMREFFDHYLKGGESPEWLEKGVAHLDLEEHLKERSSVINPEVGQAAVKPPRGFKRIFNGTDFDGWHGMGHFDPRELEALSDEDRKAKRKNDMAEMRRHWRVKNGEIVNDGKGPYLSTDKEYGDIELRIEYKTVPKADSGIYLRTTPQVQIGDYTEEGGKWERGADKGSGGLWNNSPGAAGKDPLVLADKPFGEWNKLRIIQIGERTTVYLNEKLVVDHARMENFWDRDKPLRGKGHIQLQTHSGEICWRNIFLKEIAGGEANQYLADKSGAGFVSVFDGRSLDGWEGPLDHYEVVDGEVMCEPGRGGTIYFNEELSDFQVRFRVEPAVTQPAPPQIRTSGFPASGSSSQGFAA